MSIADTVAEKPQWHLDREQMPITLVQYTADPRAAQLQILFASMDERGKQTLLAMAGAMVRLHKD